MDERERTGLLKIDFEAVDALVDRDKKEFFSGPYLKDNLEHMREHQPGLAGLIEEKPISDFHELQYFRSGALSTYDLIHMSDPEHWDSHELSDQVLYTTQKNFHDSIAFQRNGEVKTDRDRAVGDLGWFLDKVTADSPRYAEWLEYAADGMQFTDLVDFLYGSLLTAMPFYITREGETFEELFKYK